MNKIILLILILVCQSSVLTAQIKGKVVSYSTAEPIPYANIVAYDKDGKFLCGTTSIENGDFALNYSENVKRLAITCIGYEKKDSCSIDFLKEILVK